MAARTHAIHIARLCLHYSTPKHLCPPLVIPKIRCYNIKMNIWGIETSCDETAAAIIKDGQQILSNVVVSQIDIFKAYGGVIPEIAARSHLEAIQPVIDQAFKEAGFIKDGQPDWSQIDAIAVTHTPGLLGSLLVGTLTARTLAILHNKPLYATHHLKSHIYAAWLKPEIKSENMSSEGAFAVTTRSSEDTRDGGLAERPEEDVFPILSLVISGGHTQLIYMKKHNNFEIIGTTRDDAVGECFDKVAKILGLPYPGGPAITTAANGHIQHSDGTTAEVNPGNPHKYHLPHPKLSSPARNKSNFSELDFSFSGLKTAVLRAVQAELKKPLSFPSHQLAPLLTDQQIADFAASFEQTAVDILLNNLQKALKTHPVKSVIIAGGVSANQRLREEALGIFPQHKASDKKTLAKAQQPKATAARVAKQPGAKGVAGSSIKVFLPDSRFSGDNAAMVATAAFYEHQSGVKPTDPYSLNILPRSNIS